MFDVIDTTNPKLIGSCDISLLSLSEDPLEIDQMKKDKLYDLTDGKGETKVRLALQWIYSRVKLLEDILQMLKN